VQRVTQIAQHIARDRPRAASKWVDEVFAAAAALGQFPESGRVVPEVGREEIREVFQGEYRIVYKVESRRVAVLTVRHGRRRFRLEGEPPPKAPAEKPPQN
jgi:plasmid stabilization system protein ParE